MPHTLRPQPHQSPLKTADEALVYSGALPGRSRLGGGGGDRRRTGCFNRWGSWPLHITPPPPPCSTAGTALGYASSLLYLLSRLSQLWKNHVRGSAEGLAISMFLCAIAANSLYGASILLRCASAAELRSSLPWLVGSLGTVALDLGILVQSRALGGAPKHHPSDEDEPLLQP